MTAAISVMPNRGEKLHFLGFRDGFCPLRASPFFKGKASRIKVIPLHNGNPNGNCEGLHRSRNGAKGGRPVDSRPKSPRARHGIDRRAVPAGLRFHSSRSIRHRTSLRSRHRRFLVLSCINRSKGAEVRSGERRPLTTRRVRRFRCIPEQMRR